MSFVVWIEAVATFVLGLVGEIDQLLRILLDRRHALDDHFDATAKIYSEIFLCSK